MHHLSLSLCIDHCTGTGGSPSEHLKLVCYPFPHSPLPSHPHSYGPVLVKDMLCFYNQSPLDSSSCTLGAVGRDGKYGEGIPPGKVMGLSLLRPFLINILVGSLQGEMSPSQGDRVRQCQGHTLIAPPTELVPEGAAATTTFLTAAVLPPSPH